MKTVEAVRQRCVFTTHTPVPAGHDTFSPALAEKVLGKEAILSLKDSGFFNEGDLNMTRIALYFSRYINGVAMRHREVSQDMFPEYPIDSITNGIHALTFVVPAMARLYDRYFPEWRRDSLYLRHAISIPLEEFRKAHQEAKFELFEEIRQRTGRAFDIETFTIGFARRSTAYKRADLLLSDPERLAKIAREVGPLQLVYAGKAHPKDEEGMSLIRRIHQASSKLGDGVQLVYLQDYDMRLGKLLCSGVDLWLNTPRKPQEASGTSGMKAAANGVPSLSILDGWWIEGHFEGVTGWSIGDLVNESDDDRESASLYDKLENVVAPALLPGSHGLCKCDESRHRPQRLVFQCSANGRSVRPQRVPSCRPCRARCAFATGITTSAPESPSQHLPLSDTVLSYAPMYWLPRGLDCLHSQP